MRKEELLTSEKYVLNEAEYNVIDSLISRMKAEDLYEIGQISDDDGEPITDYMYNNEEDEYIPIREALSEIHEMHMSSYPYRDMNAEETDTYIQLINKLVPEEKVQTSITREKIEAVKDELATHGIEMHIGENINLNQLSVEFYCNNENEKNSIWFSKEDIILYPVVSGELSVTLYDEEKNEIGSYHNMQMKNQQFALFEEVTNIHTDAELRDAIENDTIYHSHGNWFDIVLHGGVGLEETLSSLDELLNVEYVLNLFERAQEIKAKTPKNKGITVKELLKMCQEQVDKGNGDKYIQISNDDEGNGFHTLFFEFTDNLENIKEYERDFHDEVDINEIVLLG